MYPPSANTHLDIGELRRGVWLPWLVVMDDFLRDPDALRSKALGMAYAGLGNYPGRNSVGKIRLDGLTENISSLVHEPLHTPWTEGYSHQNCRLALASDDTPGRVHIDTSHWTGILCLSRDEDTRGGTEFFRHRRTGTDRLPLTQASLAAAGYRSYAELDADILQKDALDRSKWDLILSVPMRYNRLILIQPYFWHTAGPGFGDCVENGRLVYLMFFNRVPRVPRPG